TEPVDATLPFEGVSRPHVAPRTSGPDPPSHLKCPVPGQTGYSTLGGARHRPRWPDLGGPVHFGCPAARRTRPIMPAAAINARIVGYLGTAGQGRWGGRPLGWPGVAGSDN